MGSCFSKPGEGGGAGDPPPKAPKAESAVVVNVNPSTASHTPPQNAFTFDKPSTPVLEKRPSSIPEKRPSSVPPEKNGSYLTPAQRASQLRQSQVSGRGPTVSGTTEASSDGLWRPVKPTKPTALPGGLSERTKSSLTGKPFMNAQGSFVSELVTHLQDFSKYRDQLQSRFEPLCQVLRTTFSAPRVAITLLCRHPQTRELTCFRIAGQENEIGKYFELHNSPAETLFQGNMHECLFIEDARTSAYKDHFLTRSLKIQFLAAAPLWSTDGTFVGCFTVSDVKPRKVAPHEAIIMKGLADVIMRDIEHFYLLTRAEQAASEEDNSELGQLPMERDLSLSDNLREGILVINRNWTALYGNVTWESMSGYAADQTEGISFWTFFKETLGVSGSNLGFLTDDTPPFTLEGYLRLANGLYKPAKAKFVSVTLDRSEEEARMAEVRMGNSGKKYNIAFASDAQKTAILATRASTNSAFSSDGAQSTWTVTITLEGPDSSASSSETKVSLDKAGLKVGDITLKWRIGQGGFGVVFAGSRPDGKIVAVKLTQRACVDIQMDSSGDISQINPYEEKETDPDASHRSTGAQNFKDPFMEALLSVTLNHPNLVRSYEYVLTKEGEDVLGTIEGLVKGAPPSKVLGAPSQERKDAAPEKAGSFVWLIQEYCDLGTLDRASISGSFVPTRQESQLLILSTLWDVAQGIHHLHTRNLIHGDLTGNNVLLMSADPPVNGKAYIAKVSDFGLTRLAGKRSREGYSTSILTSTFGTIIYMPPELVCDGVMNSRTDSYSFGSLIYLMLMGKRPFSEFREHQLLLRFVSKPEYMLEFPAEFQCEAELLQLAKDCLQSNYKARPSSQQLIDRIKVLWKQFGFEAKIGPLAVPPTGI